ncbi:hypothetical protein ORN12_05350 [Pantoea vagans]|uniref:hypothetical protein n=1 Tax=Pantoea vagans TaxID=470934 RepID=UPI002259747A|nr:hypothetical protein [Pantoea vagans]MCX3308437.1 hypothetical protein [Pantoea vagans]
MKNASVEAFYLSSQLSLAAVGTIFPEKDFRAQAGLSSESKVQCCLCISMIAYHQPVINSHIGEASAGIFTSA